MGGSPGWRRVAVRTAGVVVGVVVVVVVRPALLLVPCAVALVRRWGHGARRREHGARRLRPGSVAVLVAVFAVPQDLFLEGKARAVTREADLNLILSPTSNRQS